MKPSTRTRNLILVLGDQLNNDSAAFDGFDLAVDRVWMAEVSDEATRVWSHKARIAIFLAAMRHFREALQDRGIRVDYHALDDPHNRGSFASELDEAVRRFEPKRIIAVEPGEWRVRQSLAEKARELGTPIEFRRDRHFLCSGEEFEVHAEGRKVLLLEFFYREMRRKTGLLMDGKNPLGGRWNYDENNRKTFPSSGPGRLPQPMSFPPDAITRGVIALVQERFPGHPGSLAHFDWPVTPQDASEALKDFMRRRLRDFGPYEDALWSGQPFLFHSRLSSSLNLKLLDPRDAIRAAENALRRNLAPLNSVEGFVRQILGWREYVRGIYWLEMPGYAKRNALNARLRLPSFYWTGDTDMNCLRECIKQTLDYGFAHHIQRLMVTGLFALLLGVDPKEVHEWYLAIYVDAVEWVELPNTLGMSQHADGGIMASKPYVATGKYIKRMSNYCESCQYDASQAIGNRACPFTTLYWDFLVRNERALAANTRVQLQLKNVQRTDREQIRNIQRHADRIKAKCTS